MQERKKFKKGKLKKMKKRWYCVAKRNGETGKYEVFIEKRSGEKNAGEMLFGGYISREEAAVRLNTLVNVEKREGWRDEENWEYIEFEADEAAKELNKKRYECLSKDYKKEYWYGKDLQRLYERKVISKEYIKGVVAYNIYSIDRKENMEEYDLKKCLYEIKRYEETENEILKKEIREIVEEKTKLADLENYFERMDNNEIGVEDFGLNYVMYDNELKKVIVENLTGNWFDCEDWIRKQTRVDKRNGKKYELIGWGFTLREGLEDATEKLLLSGLKGSGIDVEKAEKDIKTIYGKAGEKGKPESMEEVEFDGTGELENGIENGYKDKILIRADDGKYTYIRCRGKDKDGKEIYMLYGYENKGVEGIKYWELKKDYGEKSLIKFIKNKGA